VVVGVVGASLSSTTTELVVGLLVLVPGESLLPLLLLLLLPQLLKVCLLNMLGNGWDHVPPIRRWEKILRRNMHTAPGYVG